MPEEPSQTYALEAGVSNGPGKCFALKLAKQEINTILIALPDIEVQQLCEQCKSYGVNSMFHKRIC